MNDVQSEPGAAVYAHLPGLHVELHTDVPGLANKMAGIFSGGSPGVPGAGGDVRSVTVHASARPAGAVEIRVAGAPAYRAPAESDAVHYLETLATDRLSRHLESYILLHSAAVAMNGVGILLPGPSGSGKSTAATALSLEGFEYFSDEVTVLDAGGRHLFPFPKIPSIKPGGRTVISDAFGPGVKFIHDAGDAGSSYVDVPVGSRPQPGGEGVPVRYILLPRVPQAEPSRVATVIEPLRKTDALVSAVHESLDLAIKREAGFDALVNTISSAECYSIEFGDVRHAARLVADLVGSTRQPV